MIFFYSAQGTVIRVFNLPQCQILYELHRGNSPCTIFSLAFDNYASMLAVSSSRGTVHVFHLTDEDKLTKKINLDEDKRHDIDDGQSSLKSSSKQRWYDPLLSSVKKSKNNEDGTKAATSKMKIIRSIAKIKCEKKPSVVPNTIAILPTTKTTSSKDDYGDEEDSHVAICFENGKLLIYAIRKSTSSMMKIRPRPVLADDIMFESNDAISV